MSKGANKKGQRSRSSWGGLHAPSWATPHPPTCAGLSPRRPCGTAYRAPSAGPPSSGCSGTRTPRWGSAASAPGNTVHRRACPICLQNSSSFWPLGDRDPALSWSRRVSPDHWVSHWWWGPGVSKRSKYSSPGRKCPCLYLQNKQYRPHVSKRPMRCLHLFLPLFSIWIVNNISGSVTQRILQRNISGHSLLYVHTIIGCSLRAQERFLCWKQ